MFGTFVRLFELKSSSVVSGGIVLSSMKLKFVYECLEVQIYLSCLLLQSTRSPFSLSSHSHSVGQEAARPSISGQIFICKNFSFQPQNHQ